MVRVGVLGVVAAGALLLGGCQSLSGWGDDTLSSERVEQRIQEPDCTGETCAVVSADYLRFPQAPELSQQLEQRLFSLASGLSDNPDGNAMGQADTLETFAEQVFAASRASRNDYGSTAAGYIADLNAEVVADNAATRVVELNGYLFSGGAHGLPLTEYMVIDRQNQAAVGLDDMLRPGQRQAYQVALARAHQTWLTTDQAAGLSKAQWPLSVSTNAAPMQEGLAVKYQVYDIAPYAVGQPTLVIPYAELEGVLRSRYLP